MTRALVYGLAVAGAATVRALHRHGVEVVVADDEVTADRRRLADELDVEIIERPTGSRLEGLIRACGLVSPAPGVPETHDVVTVAQTIGVEIVSEIELAYRWEQQRSGERARCWPSRAPTARRPRPCSRSRCCAPEGCARSTPGTPRRRWSMRSPSISMRSSSRRRASGWPGHRRSVPMAPPG